MLGFTKIFYPVVASMLHHFIFILVVLCDETIKAIFCVVAKDMDVLFLGLILCYAHTSVHRDWTKTFFCQAFSYWHMTPALQHRFFYVHTKQIFPHSHHGFLFLWNTFSVKKHFSNYGKVVFGNQFSSGSVVILHPRMLI